MSIPGFDIEFTPLPSVIQAGFQDLFVGIQSFKEPLTTAVNKVVIPGIQQNFAVGGRPPWPPLSDSTLVRKGGDDRILIRSGKLARVAAQKNVWQINGGYGIGEGTAKMTGLPGVEYGFYHLTGTSRMPIRDFLTINEEEAQAIEDIFGDYVDMRIARALGKF